MSEPIDALAAALADRYRIERELGRGGMATVYLAEDLRHGRRVAIKVLRPELSGTMGSGRFLREIRIAASLTHPQILSIHDSGEAAGVLYYVMPHVEGESLRDRLDREGQLPIEDAMLIAQEVADALAFAHARGVVHRDIKPENILLSDGHAVVADFGIARAVDAAGGERLTGTGIALGTPAYMSPEQTGGGKVDGRADLYSLACVVYEMLVGEPPFTGPSVQAVLARHSLEPIPSVRLVRSTVPAAIEAAITRALAKAPADRFPTVRQFAEALAAPRPPGEPEPPLHGPVRRGRRLRGGRRVAAVAALAVGLLVLLYGAVVRFGPTARPEHGARVAVLPFANFGAPEDEYFADGLTEEITGRLASTSTVDVIARTSAMQYKRTAKTVRQIGDELDVGYLIEGSVRFDRTAPGQGRIRVSARLIKVEDGTQLWRQDSTVVLAGVFEVQSRIATAVTEALNLVLPEAARRRLAVKPTQNLEAYDYYLRGNAAYNRSWLRPDVEEALAMYQRATTLDPRFAPAFAKLGRTHAWMHRLQFDPTEPRLEAARVAVDSALVLEPDLPEAHIALGLYRYWGRWDYERAIDALMTARRLQPSNALVYQNIGNIRRRQGRWEETLTSYRRAAELDPRSGVIWFNIGESLLHMRRYDEVAPLLERARMLTPDFLEPYLIAAELAVHQDGDAVAAARVLEAAARQVPPAKWRPFPGMWLFGLARIVDQAAGFFGDSLVAGRYGLDSSMVELARADRLAAAGRAREARAAYQVARARLEVARARRPEDAWVHGALAVANASLGRRDDALALARRATELIPVSRDALDGPYWIVTTARVHAILGEPDSAANQLELALSIPSRVSANWLRLDPAWAGVRNYPSFRRILRRRAGVASETRGERL